MLIYLATDNRKFAILGDEGIHRVVPENYWEDVKDKMQAEFQKGRFLEGICLGDPGDRGKAEDPFPGGRK